MIPYEDLERALARWKVRTQAAAGMAVDEGEQAVHEVQEMDAEPDAPTMPAPPRNGARRPPPEQSGEISLEEEVIETYEGDEEP